MRCVPFIAHIHSMEEGAVPATSTFSPRVDAVIECMFEVAREKTKPQTLLEFRLLLQPFIHIARATAAFIERERYIKPRVCIRR